MFLEHYSHYSYHQGWKLPTLTHKTVFRSSGDNLVIISNWFHYTYHFQKVHHNHI